MLIKLARVLRAGSVLYIAERHVKGMLAVGQLCKVSERKGKHTLESMSPRSSLDLGIPLS